MMVELSADSPAYLNHIPVYLVVLHNEYVKPMPWWHSSAQIFDFVSAHFSVPSISSSDPEIWTTFAHTAFPLGFPTLYRPQVLPNLEAAGVGLSPVFNFQFHLHSDAMNRALDATKTSGLAWWQKKNWLWQQAMPTKILRDLGSSILIKSLLKYRDITSRETGYCGRSILCSWHIKKQTHYFVNNGYTHLATRSVGALWATNWPRNLHACKNDGGFLCLSIEDKQDRAPRGGLLVIVIRRGLKDLGRVLYHRTVPLAIAIAVAEPDGAMHLAMMSQIRNQMPCVLVHLHTIVIVVPLAHSARWDLLQLVGALETSPTIATRRDRGSCTRGLCIAIFWN
jgi:hypothetical protein